MMHGPCGHDNKNSPCIKDGKCSIFFPKKWQCGIVVDEDGYPVYRRRNDGKYIEKNQIALDNRYIVAYNPNLLLKYQAHCYYGTINQHLSNIYSSTLIKDMIALLLLLYLSKMVMA